MRHVEPTHTSRHVSLPQRPLRGGRRLRFAQTGPALVGAGQDTLNRKRQWSREADSTTCRFSPGRYLALSGALPCHPFLVVEILVFLVCLALI